MVLRAFSLDEPMIFSVAQPNLRWRLVFLHSYFFDVTFTIGGRHLATGLSSIVLKCDPHYNGNGIS